MPHRGYRFVELIFIIHFAPSGVTLRELGNPLTGQNIRVESILQMGSPYGAQIFLRRTHVNLSSFKPLALQGKVYHLRL